MRIEVKNLITLYVDGKPVPPNSVVSLDEKEVEYLASRNMVEIPGTKEVAEAPPKTTPPEITQESIVAVIQKLDKDKDFTSGGLPKVEAIEKLLGANITAQQRNDAWAQLEAAQSQGTGATE